jgi:hypothetical protein
MDNPVQVKRSTGLRNHNTRNCVAVQHAHGNSIPRATLRLHGVIHIQVLRT